MKYRLLKDLPDLPKGGVFKRFTKENSDPEMYYFSCPRNGGDGQWVYMFSLDALERNSDWFEKLE